MTKPESWELEKVCSNCYWYKPDQPQFKCGLFSINCTSSDAKPLFTSLRKGLEQVVQREETAAVDNQ